jgi:hypothetical protein
MANEKAEEKKVQEIEFLQRLGQMAWPMADVAGKMVEIDRPDKENRSFGFKDLNGRKEIVLTATREQWKTWFEAALEKG